MSCRLLLSPDLKVNAIHIIIIIWTRNTISPRSKNSRNWLTKNLSKEPLKTGKIGSSLQWSWSPFIASTECPCPNCRNKMIKKGKSDHLPSQLLHSSSWQSVNRIASLREVEVFLFGWAIVLWATSFVFGKMSVAPISKLIVLLSSSF